MALLPQGYRCYYVMAVPLSSLRGVDMIRVGGNIGPVSRFGSGTLVTRSSGSSDGGLDQLWSELAFFAGRR